LDQLKNSYKYQLEKGSKKYPCPDCNHKSLVRYIDNDRNEHLPEEYGRCDRESKCGYHINPYKAKYGKDEISIYHLSKPRPRYKMVYIPNSILKATLSLERYSCNVFLQNLISRIPYPFSHNDISDVAALYSLGTVTKGYLYGSVTFPYIDIKNNVRAIQVRKFDNDNHGIQTSFIHSIIEQYNNKNKLPQPDWLRSYFQNEKVVSCLFGEHLLSLYPYHTVALVEAPKTAIYGTLYFGLPQQGSKLIWLSVYNQSSFTIDKLRVLEGRKVIVYPDLSKDGSTFKEWKSKAESMRKIDFTFSTILEDYATVEEKNKGLDLADYLIQKDWREYRS
jgi:hypothetical protein